MATPNPETIRHLNTILKAKLTGINQYFLHARILKHQGNMQLADYEYKASIDAMKHSDMLVEHVLQLGGKPQMQELGKLSIGEEAGDMLAGDLSHAETLLTEIKAAVEHCEALNDKASVALLTRLLEHQQERLTFLQTNLFPKAA